MLASLVTSHSKILQDPDSAMPAYPHSWEAFVGSRTVARTWSPRARSCRTHSRPMPLLAPMMTHVAGLLQIEVMSIENNDTVEYRHKDVEATRQGSWKTRFERKRYREREKGG